MPADSENLLLPGDGSSGVQPLIETSGAGKYNLIRPGFSPKLEWLDTIPIVEESRGSLPVSNTTNGGLQGTLYFDDDGEGDTTAMHAVDLQSGTDLSLFKLTDDYLDNVSDLVYASRDGQYFSHHYSDVYDDAIYILDQNGQMLSGILTEGNNYDMGVSAPVRFSPQDPDLILVSYYDVYENSSSYLDDVVSVIDWRTRTFVKHFDSREYLAADWSSDGDVVLFWAGRDGNVYLAEVNGRSFADPILYIPTKDEITTIAVSPDGSKIAYTLNRHIWISDFDGQDFRRLTGFSEGLQYVS